LKLLFASTLIIRFNLIFDSRVATIGFDCNGNVYGYNCFIVIMYEFIDIRVSSS